jgi:8-oxo-dGTP pyrophosphatase MutT (NUDIX family)
LRLYELIENDEHWDTLDRTGFWGKRGAGVIFKAQDTGRLLIARRSDEVQEPGTWGTWGGALDEGEQPEAAAYREATEETGYSGPVDIKHLWTFKHPNGFQYFNYLATVPSEFKPTLNWETDDYKWVNPGQWPNPLHPGLQALIQNANL